MKQVKLFETSTMPDWLFEWLRECQIFIEDGIAIYNVGDLARDVLNGKPEDYAVDTLKRTSEADWWFITNGAVGGEVVLVSHGTFHLKW